MNVTPLAFGLGLLAASGIYALLFLTLATGYRLWPPGSKTPAYYLHWGLVAVFNVGLVVVAVRDWNTWLLPRPSSLVVGVVLAALGTAVFVRSAGAMRSDETMGVTGDLHTGGPYAYSRNPQYVGMLVGLVGFALLVNSRLLTALVVVHVGWVLLLPRAEEPHLRATYGEEYERYRARVPRFVGRETLRALVSNEPTRRQ